MPDFDEALVARPDGTTQRLTRDEFFKVPLIERVQLLCDFKVKFVKSGQQMSPVDALR